MTPDKQTIRLMLNDPAYRRYCNALQCARKIGLKLTPAMVKMLATTAQTAQKEPR